MDSQTFLVCITPPLIEASGVHTAKGKEGVCVCACVRACIRACIRACVCVCVCVCAFIGMHIQVDSSCTHLGA